MTVLAESLSTGACSTKMIKKSYQFKKNYEGGGLYAYAQADRDLQLASKPQLACGWVQNVR